MEIERALIIVADSVGVGEMPDAGQYGDEGSDTIGNIARVLGGLHLPNLQKLGLGNLHEIEGVAPHPSPGAYYARMQELSAGKDTTTGHWEICGVITEKPFPTYPHGFPKEVIEEFERETGRKTLGNYPCSGTEIISRLGEEHVRTGSLIVYTSADSVFQVAAHEEVVPLEQLYEYCKIARRILKGENSLSRVIARPFLGTPGSFYRTEGRKDYSLAPPRKTLLDLAKDAGMWVMGIGKIEDIFAFQGLTDSDHTGNNKDGLECIIRVMKERTGKGIVMVNLVDFDMLYGHRNNVKGYAQALVDFDGYIPAILDTLGSRDVLIITADHGCDPTTASTDHSREHVPLLFFAKSLPGGKSLGMRDSFADIAATLKALFTLEGDLAGTSFVPQLG